MKKFIPFVALVLCHYSSGAQLTRSQVSNDFTSGIVKVVQNFGNNYRHIQGEALPAEEQRDIFRSLVTLPGSLQNVIYRFHSKEDTTASWQSLLFSGEGYENAVKAYRNACRNLGKTRIIFPSGTSGFSGKINDPDPSLNFTTSLFRLDTDEPAYKNFYAEVELLNTGFESWDVQLNLHSRKEDTERY
jgi:hypothetical protein